MVAISFRRDKGLYSPVLRAGRFPLVEGFVTSFDRIGAVLLASYLLPHAEPALRATGLGAVLGARWRRGALADGLHPKRLLEWLMGSDDSLWMEAQYGR